MKLFSFALFCFLGTFVFSQEKKIIDHTVYNDWKKLQNQQVSVNGTYVSYEIVPHRGDGYLYLKNTKTEAVDSFFCGVKAQFSPNEEYFVYTRTPGFDTLRTCELKKVDKKKWPKEDLVIVRLSDRQETVVPNKKGFTLSKETSWMAYSIDSNLVEKTPEPKKKRFRFFKKKKKEVKTPKVSSEGKLMYLFNPVDGTKLEFKNVSDFDFSPQGTYLVFTEHEKIDKDETSRLFAYHILDKKRLLIDSLAVGIKQQNVSENDKLLAYLYTRDTTKHKNYTLHLYDLNDRKSYMSLDSNFSAIGSGNMISENQSLVFTKNNRYLFFGVAPETLAEPEDTLLASEKYTLDLWHYQDKRLQPEQLLRKKSDEKASNLFSLDLGDFHIQKIENDSLKTRAQSNLEGDYLLLSNVLPYQQTYNWTFPNLEDHYRISLKDGAITPLRMGIGMGGELSPSGRYYTYYDESQEQFYFLDIDNNTGSCITCGKEVINFKSDNNGMPFTPYPLGIIGFDRAEETVYLRAEYDIYRYSMTTRELTPFTFKEGLNKKIKFSPRSWERDSVYVVPSNMYLMGFDEKTKDEMIYAWPTAGEKSMRKLYQTPHTINTVQKSKNSEQIILRKSNLRDYADLYAMDGNFKNEKRISTSNPQQSEYNWATVELMDYTSYDGQKLQALLYKPENFDTTKKYPLLVYFYELYTDELHNHYAPKPTASIIYPTEYASAGYVVMIPDIRYKEGYPAKSAYNCIMAATDAALKKVPAIDSLRMGLQGQSWGGYQTAQLVTMTTRYRAAMAGAPVANMFSAYGGIRWGSGLNRQFQYEKTQSRIGKTIWEAPALYTENSPLFHLPKVKTPLLIMHNDEDGAVPWYQGIELFTGMKRLGKECWLLNYNGDDHNLMKNANRFDLSIRMRQFFDYYLLEAPAPRWLIEGIPATAKGKESRYELMESEK